MAACCPPCWPPTQRHRRERRRRQPRERRNRRPCPKHEGLATREGKIRSSRMSKPKDLDIFARSLSGDWESRNELFKRFVWGNSRVRRLGLRYGQLDDFLHDCFTNLLRTGHQFNKEQDLDDWVESVAAWTALERQRLRDVDEGQVRLCAGGE